MTTTCIITWPDGAQVEATHDSVYSNSDADVVWTGAIGKLEDPPKSTDACILEAYLRDQAEKSHGTIEVSRRGTWPMPDEVKS